MAPPLLPARKGKRLLVAAVGVATVSFVSAQGCEPDTTTFTSGNLLPAPPMDAGPRPASGDSGDAVGARDAAVGEGTGTTIFVSGNLLPPPGADASDEHDRQADRGGALDASPRDGAPEDAARDTGLPTSGNLLLPPRDAAVADAATKDAGRRIGMPPSGNLLPPAPAERVPRSP